MNLVLKTIILFSIAKMLLYRYKKKAIKDLSIEEGLIMIALLLLLIKPISRIDLFSTLLSCGTILVYHVFWNQFMDKVHPQKYITPLFIKLKKDINRFIPHKNLNHHVNMEFIMHEQKSQHPNFSEVNQQLARHKTGI
jgi:hypothetical protein